MKRAVTLLVAGIAVTAAVAAGVIGLTSSGGTDAAATDAPVVAVLDVAEVAQRDLAEYTTIPGQLLLADGVSLLAASTGAVLSLPVEGTTIERGEPLYSIVDEPTEIELLSAAAQVRQGESQLASSTNQLADLLDGSKAGDLAAAQASVATAERALAELTEPVTFIEITAAEAKVTTAQQRLDDLQTGATEAEIASAQAQLAQANTSVTSARGTASTTHATLVIAYETYCDLAVLPAAVCTFVDPSLSAADIALLEQAVVTAQTNEDPDRVVPATQTLITAAVAANNAQAALVSAQASLDSAQAALDRVLTPATAAEIEAAIADLGTAVAARDDLIDGPTPQRLDEAQANLTSAQARYSDLARGATPEAKAAAEQAVASATASLDLSSEQYSTLLDGAVTPYLLYGSTPLARDLVPNTTGPEVEQLQANLIALGFDLDGEVTVTGTFDDWTSYAVATWQHDTGQTMDGTVEIADVVFLPGPIQIDSWAPTVQPGSSVNAAMPLATVVPFAEVVPGNEADPDAALRSTQRVVADLPLAERGLAEVGDEVTIHLPDLSEHAATISAISTVPVEDPQTGESWVEITVSPDTELDAIWIGSELDVLLVEELAADALVVPVSALVALVEGGYAVEVPGAAGTSSLVAVEPGMFADGFVEISGALSVGDEVLVPK